MKRSEKKLDLMNHRFFYKNENYKIYDSCEDIPSISNNSSNSFNSFNNSNSSSFKTIGTGFHEFSRQNGRETYKPSPIYHSNEIFNPPLKNYKGEYVTCQDNTLNSPLKNVITERLHNSFELASNEAALIYHNAKVYNKSTKEAIGTGTNVIDSHLWKEIQSGNIPGGKWSASTTSRKPLMDIPNDLGPGDYEITRWEKSKFGVTHPSVKFNEIETNRLELKLVPEGTSCPSPTTYFRDSPPLPPLGSSGIQTFTHSIRFHDTSPRYLKTTGLLLSPDFDKKTGWSDKSLVDIKHQPSPRPKTDPGYQFGVDFINPDTGHKVTLKTEVEQSPMKYSSSFKSQAEVGLHIPLSESGFAGPGEYGGACDKSSLEIKLPNNHSAAFLANRELDPPVMNSKYSTLRPRFIRTKQTKSDEYVALNGTFAAKSLPKPKKIVLGRVKRVKNTYGSTTTESESMKLSHIALWTKSKMTKIYPRLAREKFGDPNE